MADDFEAQIKKELDRASFTAYSDIVANGHSLHGNVNIVVNKREAEAIFSNVLAVFAETQRQQQEKCTSKIDDIMERYNNVLDQMNEKEEQHKQQLQDLWNCLEEICQGCKKDHEHLSLSKLCDYEETAEECNNERIRRKVKPLLSEGSSAKKEEVCPEGFHKTERCNPPWSEECESNCPFGRIRTPRKVEGLEKP